MVYCFKLYAFIAKPFIATDKPAEIGITDFIILCTKTYDLESTIKQLELCIDKDTIILPLLNGVNNKEKIKSLLPYNMVLDGCVYIVSRLKAPAIIENSGNIQTLYFGLDNFVNEKLRLLESLFKQADIEATLSQNISSIIWEKFIFISPTATATSYFNNCIGQVLSDNEKLKFISLLIEEVKQIAKAKKIKVPDNITEKVLNKLKALPFETTSSMHSDFRHKKNNTELESLTGYVLRQGIKYNLATPTYRESYEKLLLNG